MDERIEALRAYLDSAHSVYHAVAGLQKELENGGYTRLFEQDAWELQPGGKYYLTRGGAAVMAFRIPEGSPAGFMMSASHADHPTFKVKENGELTESTPALPQKSTAVCSWLPGWTGPCPLPAVSWWKRKTASKAAWWISTGICC